MFIKITNAVRHNYDININDQKEYKIYNIL